MDPLTTDHLLQARSIQHRQLAKLQSVIRQIQASAPAFPRVSIDAPYLLLECRWVPPAFVDEIQAAMNRIIHGR